MTNKLIIIDYGMGNLRSVQKAFERINVSASVSTDPNYLVNADKIVLPGVGHFKQGMKNLIDSGFADAIKDAILIRKKSILGICLGMQLLTEHSEEGDVNGLGLVKGKTIKFPPMELKIPHMGWNTLNIKKASALSLGLTPSDYLYFVHSYYVTCDNPEDILFQTEYGLTFDAAFQHENIVGFQFHPEKSHKTGLTLLENFIKL
jgi:imidazole glycerol-phosphate synthase subunit HisH